MKEPGKAPIRRDSTLSVVKSGRFFFDHLVPNLYSGINEPLVVISILQPIH